MMTKASEANGAFGNGSVAGRTGALPVAVIGAGPVGLAAAAHLLQRGMEPVVFEAGEAVGTSIREWGHVRLFTPWRHLVDRASRELLLEAGWNEPDGDQLPLGRELVERYLEPLARHPRLAGSLRLGSRVISVSRLGVDRLKSADRSGVPFLVVSEGAQGERRQLVQAVIDASGTWTDPNPLGASGIAAFGEREHQAKLRYGIPDVASAERKRYRGKRTAVVGSGHSALQAVIELERLSREEGGSVTWVMRRAAAGGALGGGAADELPERARIGSTVHELLEAGRVKLEAGFSVAEIRTGGSGVELISLEGRTVDADEVVVATGYRPDLSGLRELRLELDPITEAPVKLAPLIDPNVHSCGTVPPHGALELAHPEEGFYLAGMKSYGRAPTFLLLTGYEQVRSIAAMLAGDVQSARRVELELPHAGVCCSTSTTGGCEAPGQAAGASACGSAAGAGSSQSPTSPVEASPPGASAAVGAASDGVGAEVGVASDGANATVTPHAPAGARTQAVGVTSGDASATDSGGRADGYAELPVATGGCCGPV